MSYTTRTDIETAFGAENVKKWADVDNDGSTTKIAARIASAILWADRRVDNLLRGGPYLVPATGDDLATIADYATTFAGCWLYECRGTTDYNPETGAPEHRYGGKNREAEDALRKIRNGQTVLRLSEAYSGSTTSCPIVVKG